MKEIWEAFLAPMSPPLEALGKKKGDQEGRMAQVNWLKPR